MKPEPTFDRFLSIGTGAIRAREDEDADTRRGSVYEYILAPSALTWTRQAQRDTDLFADTRFSSASDTSLTELVKRRFSIDRVLDTPGTGTAVVTRLTTSGGSGKFFKGTRIFVPSSASDPAVYYVSETVTVNSADLKVSIPIESEKTGVGVFIDTTNAVFDDAIWDPSWNIESLKCNDGTVFEDADDLRARVKTTKRSARVGYLDKIVEACRAAGADRIVAFQSDRVVDYGLNVIYVGDKNFHTTDKLIRDVKLKLEGVRNFGDNVQVLGMTSSRLVIDADVTLVNPPTSYNLNLLSNQLKGAISNYFAPSDAGFSYDRIAMQSAMVAVSNHAVAQVTFNTPSSDAVLMVNTIAFPSVLTRYTVNFSDITFNFKASA